MVVLMKMPVITTPMQCGITKTVTIPRLILTVPVSVFLQWIVQMFAVEMHIWIIVTTV